MCKLYTRSLVARFSSFDRRNARLTPKLTLSSRAERNVGQEGFCQLVEIESFSNSLESVAAAQTLGLRVASAGFH